MTEQISEDEIERLHELVSSVELQLRNIGEHYPNAYGPAMLALATYMVEKIYISSQDVESANLLLGSAQEQGLQNWIDTVEREEGKSRIITEN